MNNELRWITAVLSNDENSTDEELIAYFVENGVSEAPARKHVANREHYLKEL